MPVVASSIDPNQVPNQTQPVKVVVKQATMMRKQPDFDVSLQIDMCFIFCSATIMLNLIITL
jgi:hypothetical protein